jgi:hypothetical protein
LVSIGLVLSGEKISEKVYDRRRRRTPSDGNSSPDGHNFGKNCRKILIIKFVLDTPQIHLHTTPSLNATVRS